MRRNLMYGCIGGDCNAPHTGTLTTGLIAGYKMDGDFLDVLNVANGTAVNGATHVTGAINQGGSFDGVSSYVDCGTDIPSRGLTFPLSFSLFLKYQEPIASSGAGVFMLDDAIGSAGHYNGFRFSIGGISGGAHRFNAGIGGVGNIIRRLRVSNDFILLPNVKYHIIVVWTDAFTCDLYLNNVLLVANWNTAGTWTSLNWEVGAKTVIGTNFNGNRSTPLTPYNGMIDELYFWNKILTSDERTELYGCGGGKQYPFV